MLENLSPRERELFDLLIKGVSPKDIAYKLNLKPSTVDYYRTNLYNKLGIHSIQELLVKYSTNGKENTPELAQSEPQPSPLEKTINIPQTKKHKKLKFLLPVGAAFIALSVLFGWIFIKKSSANHTQKGVKIPVNNMGFFATADSEVGGKSTTEVFITHEEIDGVGVDVLNIKINLINEDGAVYASICTNKPDLIQQLRQANGIRFKTRGDGKIWNVQFQTAETTEERNYASYSYIVGTARDQIIVVDIPYSSLYLPEWYEQYSFDFNKKTIRTLIITANRIHGYGPSLLQIFDFEIF